MVGMGRSATLQKNLVQKELEPEHNEELAY